MEPNIMQTGIVKENKNYTKFLIVFYKMEKNLIKNKYTFLEESIDDFTLSIAVKYVETNDGGPPMDCMKRCRNSHQRIQYLQRK